MFTFKHYFKIKKNSRAYLPEENKKAVFLFQSFYFYFITAIYFKVSTPVRSYKNAGFGEKKKHRTRSWQLKFKE